MQIYNVAHLFHVPRSTFNCNDRRKIVHPYNETNITPFGWAEISTGYTQSTIVWYAEYGIEHMRQLTRCNLIPNSHLFYLLFFILFSFPNIKENELNWFVLFRDVVLQLVRAVHQTAKEIQLEKKNLLFYNLVVPLQAYQWRIISSTVLLAIWCRFSMACTQVYLPVCVRVKNCNFLSQLHSQFVHEKFNLISYSSSKFQTRYAYQWSYNVRYEDMDRWISQRGTASLESKVESKVAPPHFIIIFGNSM